MKKVDANIKSDKKCKICGKAIKQNLVNRKLKAPDRCYKHRIQSGQHTKLQSQRGMTIPQLAYFWIVLVSFALLPTLNEMRELKALGVNDSLQVPINVQLIDHEIVFTTMDLSSEIHGDSLSISGE